ncbi:MAG: energy-coupling factor transporter ATPase [Coriobacteriia bacterium]|nr:energy-coupling factor transporter ATPase [Coriobacteriia bacterium]MCL2750263.1 energy-coupling factor transporter ATPase [Coriobacteriia bacterium]
MTLLEFRNIDFTFPRMAKGEPEAADFEPQDEILPQGFELESNHALRRVSFTLDHGEYVVLMGANGSGKSTLAKLANGLLLPTNGEVIADGISSWEHDKLLQLRKTVGLVGQDPDNQIVSTTVFDEIAFGPQNLGWPPVRIYDAVHDALSQVGLLEDMFAKRDPNTLSGGEKQRVVIAAMLAMQPNYLVLDEPTSMLDPTARRQVLDAIRLAAKHGHGVLHITHRLEEAAEASRVLVLDRGRLCYDGPPEQLLSNPEALKRYGLQLQMWVRRYKPKPPTEGQPSLKIKIGSFAYPGSQSKEPVLKKLSLEVRTGECVLLVGESGSGKSTLLTLAAGLMKPTRGEVLLNGKTPKPGEVGLVFQHPESQLFAQTVKDDILFGPRNLKLPQADDPDALAKKVLSAVGLDADKFMNRSPFSLSGGEARRVAIATILALETEFLLLDEPIAGLDARGKVFIFELLQKLLEEGKGLIIATHDPDFFAALVTGRMDLTKRAEPAEEEEL